MTQCELSCHFLMCIHILSLFLHLSLKAGLNMFSLQGLLKDIHVFTELSTTKFSIHLSLLIHPFLFFHFSPCLQGMTSTCFLGWTFVLPHRSCWKFYSGAQMKCNWQNLRFLNNWCCDLNESKCNPKVLSRVIFMRWFTGYKVCIALPWGVYRWAFSIIFFMESKVGHLKEPFFLSRIPFCLIKKCGHIPGHSAGA